MREKKKCPKHVGTQKTKTKEINSARQTSHEEQKTQQQGPESRTNTLTWHASEYKVHKYTRGRRHTFFGHYSSGCIILSTGETLVRRGTPTKCFCQELPLSKHKSRMLCSYLPQSILSLSVISLIIVIYPLTIRVVGALQMIPQPVSSIFPCSPLQSGTWRTPGLSTP